MVADFHVHTEFSGDSTETVRAQIDQAVSLGMKEFCLTDHHDYDVISKIDFTLDFDRYFKTLLPLKEEYQNRIDLRIGVELGLQTHLKPYFDQLLSSYPFDFVIGSTHFIDRRDPSYPEYFREYGEAAVYHSYFETTLENLKALDNYDIAGHIDYIVRYGPNQTKYYSYDRYEDILDQILKTLVEKGKGMECNSAGIRKKTGSPNPGRDILRRYRQLGGEIITLGSDAHISKDLGADFAHVTELLKDCGFRYYATFQQRQAEFHQL